MSKQVEDNVIVIDTNDPESVREFADLVGNVMERLEKSRKAQQAANIEKKRKYRKLFVKRCLEKYSEWKAIANINSNSFENDRQFLSVISRSGSEDDISRVMAKIDGDPVLRNSLIAQFEKLLKVYQEECAYIGRGSAERKYNVLKAYYFSSPRLQISDVAELYKTEFGKIVKGNGTIVVDRHAIYRDLRNAIEDFSNLFWGLYSLSC